MNLSETQASKQSGYGKPISLEVIDNIAIITMRRGDNRFNYDFIRLFNEALDKVEQDGSIRALITTAEDKFYSNGLDLNWFGYLADQNQSKKIFEFLTDYHGPFHWRFVTFPVPTIAAINGHCYAAGAFLGLCHDYQIMRSKRGWYCFNEVHNGLRFGPQMLSLLRAKLPYGTTFNEASVLGLRFTGEEAAAKGIVHKTCEVENLLKEAMDLAKSITRTPYDRDSLRNMKSDIYAPLNEALQSHNPVTNSEERAAGYKKASKM